PARPPPRRDFGTRGQPRVATPERVRAAAARGQRSRVSHASGRRTAVAVCAVLVERARGRADGIAACTGCDEERVFSFAGVAHAAGSDVKRMVVRSLHPRGSSATRTAAAHQASGCGSSPSMTHNSSSPGRRTATTGSRCARVNAYGLQQHRSRV
ncbi:hypothetical protein Dimus_013257, partial [Dionaea muscipula]